MARCSLPMSPTEDDVTISESTSRVESRPSDPFWRGNTARNSPIQPHVSSSRCLKPGFSIVATRTVQSRDRSDEVAAWSDRFHLDQKQRTFDDVSSDSWTDDDEFYCGQHLPRLISQTRIPLTACVPAAPSSEYDSADRPGLMSPIRAWLKETNTHVTTTASNSPVSLSLYEDVSNTTSTTPARNHIEQIDDHQNDDSQRISLRHCCGRPKWQSRSLDGQAFLDEVDDKSLEYAEGVQAGSALISNTGLEIESSIKETLSPPTHAAKRHIKLSSSSGIFFYTAKTSMQSDSSVSSPAASRGSSLPEYPAVPWSPVSPSFHEDVDGLPSRSDISKQPSTCIPLWPLALECNDMFTNTSISDDEDKGKSTAHGLHAETHQRHKHISKPTRGRRADSGVESRLANDGTRSAYLLL